MPLLAPDAADALITLERDTDGLIYLDLWRDGIGSLLATRLRKTTKLPGYSPHNYGLSIDIDVKTILGQKMIRYEDLLHILKKRGWYCHRRDGDQNGTNSGHFDYLGDEASRLLVRCTMDPITWDIPAECRILERHGSEFQMPLQEAQEKLSKLGMFKGSMTGQSDLYTREAVIVFQRAWDLVQNGYVDDKLCRVLSFITADIDIT